MGRKQNITKRSLCGMIPLSYKAEIIQMRAIWRWNNHWKCTFLTSLHVACDSFKTGQSFLVYCLKYCEEVQVWLLPWSQPALTPLCAKILVCLFSQLLPKPPVWLLNSLLLSVTAWCCQLYPPPWHWEPLTSRVMSYLILHRRGPVIFQMEVSRFCPVFSVMRWRVRRVRGLGKKV